jgi:filamentous hemagglutinin
MTGTVEEAVYADGTVATGIGYDTLHFDFGASSPANESIAPSTPTEPESFDAGSCSDSGCSPASVPPNGTGGNGPDLEPTRASIDFLNHHFTLELRTQDAVKVLPTPQPEIARANEGVEGAGPAAPSNVDAPLYVGTIKANALWGVAGPPGLGASETIAAEELEASSTANSALLRNQLISEEIAGGHAFGKHVIQQAEFPGITNRTEFASQIEEFLNSSKTVTRNLSNGRSAFWNDSTGTVLIRNPAAPDGGTFFRPTDGINYFWKLK